MKNLVFHPNQILHPKVLEAIEKYRDAPEEIEARERSGLDNFFIKAGKKETDLADLLPVVIDNLEQECRKLHSDQLSLLYEQEQLARMLWKACKAPKGTPLRIWADFTLAGARIIEQAERPSELSKIVDEDHLF